MIPFLTEFLVGLATVLAVTYVASILLIGGWRVKFDEFLTDGWAFWYFVVVSFVLFCVALGSLLLFLM